MELIRPYRKNEFEKQVLALFRFQAAHVPVYNEFLNYLSVDPQNINRMEQIPFLPIELFKHHKIITGGSREELVFTSSGTTGDRKSRHFVADVKLYEKSFLSAFKIFYGEPSDYCILALLPSYMEQKNSSLVYMMDSLIKNSGHPDSGFYLHNRDALMKKILDLKNHRQKTLLLGVSFALVELAEKYEEDLSPVIIMETGGMKGRRKEMIREELHHLICHAFNLQKVHSEYGMTELLSQAYSKGDGNFYAPPWMKILIRDSHDPFTFLSPGKTGAINVIDLANFHSCSFIATSDLGKLNSDGSFEVLGRMDNSDIRGCNLLIA